MGLNIGALFFAAAFAVVGGMPGSNTVDFQCLSWNINGAPKFTSLTPELHFMETFDVILLQDTFTLSPENGFDLIGYIPYHVRVGAND
jgi:hypothetical protein